MKLLFSFNEIIPVAFILFALITFIILIMLFAKNSMNEINAGKRDIELIDKLIKEKDNGRRKRKNIIKIIKNVFFYAFIAFMVPFIIYIIFLRISGKVPAIGDNHYMVVGSGSMSFKNEVNDYLFENDNYKLDYQFQTGDIIVLTKVKDVSELEQYDVIGYYDRLKKENIIHRIVDIIEEDGVIKFVTRGDANNDYDTYKPVKEDLIGVYQGKNISGIGNIVIFMQTLYGIVTIIAVIVLFFAFDYYYNNYLKTISERKKRISETMDFNDLSIDVDKKLYLYYLGYVYVVINNHPIEKEKISDSKLDRRSQKIIIKIMKDMNDNIISEEELLVE